MMRYFKLLCLLIFGLLMAACSTMGPDGAPGVYLNPNDIPNAIPKDLPHSKYGNKSPYVVRGAQYYILKSAAGYDQTGIASWYGTYFHGHKTSDGARYDLYEMTAASKVLPIPTFVRVINLRNGRSAIVEVNDRGPFEKGRIIDLSYAAAVKLGYANQGTAPVRVIAITFNHHTKRFEEGNIRAPRPVTIEHHLFLQVSAFQYFDNAEKLKKRLIKITYRPILIQRRAGKYAVLIGPLPNANIVPALKKLLTAHGYKNAIPIKE